MMKLEDWRKEIDQIDADIIRLINQRASVVKKIGTLKAKAGLPILDADREEKLIRNICHLNQGILEDKSLIGIYRKIIHESRRIQADVLKKINEKGANLY